MGLEQRMVLRTDLEQRMEQLQVPQLSPRIQRFPGNRFRRERIQHFTTQRLQRLLRVGGADDAVIDRALVDFLRKIERVMPFDDFFFDEETHQRFLRGELPDVVYLNSASIGVPCPLAAEKGHRALEVEEQLLAADEPILAEALSEDLARRLRGKIAQMLRVEPSWIVLTRNVGEAAVMAAALAGIYSREQDKGAVAFADPTHISTMVNMLLVGDPGNIHGRDPWSTFPTHFRERGPRYREDELKRWLGQDAFTVFAVRGKTMKQIRNEVTKHLKACDPCAIVLPHVLRETGDVLPIGEIGRYIQEHLWKAIIIADGAQAVGNIDVDLDDLLGRNSGRPAVDFYLGALHKAMGAPPVGFVAFDPYREHGKQGLEQLRCGWAKHNVLILHGMFDPSHHIPVTAEDSLSAGDLYGALTQINELECSGHIRDLQRGPYREMSTFFLSTERGRLCYEFQKLLEAQFGERWKEKDALQFVKATHKATSFILTFRLPAVDMRMLVERLSKRGIFLTYIESYDGIRASFQPDITRAQLQRCVHLMAEEVESMGGEGLAWGHPSGTTDSVPGRQAIDGLT